MRRIYQLTNSLENHDHPLLLVGMAHSIADNMTNVEVSWVYSERDISDNVEVNISSSHKSKWKSFLTKFL